MESTSGVDSGDPNDVGGRRSHDAGDHSGNPDHVNVAGDVLAFEIVAGRQQSVEEQGRRWREFRRGDLGSRGVSGKYEAQFKTISGSLASIVKI